MVILHVCILRSALRSVELFQVARREHWKRDREQAYRRRAPIQSPLGLKAQVLANSQYCDIRRRELWQSQGDRLDDRFATLIIELDHSCV
jgi:hypothetical protein